MPVGVCGIITPWNFPIAIPSWKILPALICGNTCVLKPASDTPLTALHFIEVLQEAGTAGRGPELCHRKRLQKSATRWSSTRTSGLSLSQDRPTPGETVAAKCSAAFKKHNLEMGGKNVIMIMDDANLELAVDGALWGGFGTSGQRCTASSRLVVHKDVYKEFLDRFAERARSLRVGQRARQMRPRWGRS